MDEEPWYSPSCGEEPEYVGDIHVRLLSETAIETQIRFSDDDEWLTLRVNVSREYLMPELGAGTRRALNQRVNDCAYAQEGKRWYRCGVMSNFFSSLTWDGDCKTNFVSFCTAVFMP